MKRSILIFSLLACLFSTINQATSNPSCNNAERAIPVKTKKTFTAKKCSNSSYTITRKDFCLNGKLSQPFVITKPGKYCLGERIEFEPLVAGTCAIQILSDDVKLDLCCNTLIQVNDITDTTAICVGDQEKQDAEIQNEFKNIIVQNGNISDFTKNHMLAYDITNLDVHDINFTGGDRSENAWLIDTCNNVTVERCNVTGFLNINDTMILFESCNCVSVNDVNVCGNTKARTVSVGTFNTRIAFVGVNLCTGVEFDNVKANNNTWNSQIQPGGGRSRRNLIISVLDSFNCTLNNCETNNSVNLGGAPEGISELTRGLFIIFSDNITVTNHKSNNYLVEVPAAIYRGISTLSVDNLVLDGCQANNNVISSAVFTPDTLEITGMSFNGSIFPDTNNGMIIRNCQANGNGFITTTTLQDTGFITASGFAFTQDSIDGNISIDNCQANNNFIGSGFGLAIGMSIAQIDPDAGVANITISNSSFDSNVGDASFGGEGYGLLLQTTNNLTISNCTANSNSAFGISSIDPDSPFPISSNNLTIVDCVCNDNGNLALPSAGIAVNGENTLIKGCQVHRTFSGDKAAGIIANSARNVVIEDTNVFDTAADGNGHGILFNSCTDSKIINSQLHRNQNNGVELAGNNKNIVLRGNIALDNGDHGFNLGVFDKDIANNTYGVESVNCKSMRNGQDGFNASGGDLIFRSCISDLNSGSGYLFSPFTPFFARVATDTDLENLNIYDGNYRVVPSLNKLLLLPDDPLLAETPADLPINGVAVEEGDIVLVKDQNDGTQDGLYQASQVLEAGEELLLAAGFNDDPENPYLEFTLSVTMSGFDIIVITYNKDFYGLQGVDNCYFYPKDLVITYTAEPVEVEFPLATVLTGTIETDNSIVTDGLKWTAISDGPWNVGDLGADTGSDLAGTRVINCGFRNEFAYDYYTVYADAYPQHAVAPFDLTNSVLIITLDDPTDGREYTFDLLARLSSQLEGPYFPPYYGPDLLIIVKNKFTNPIWQLARVATWQEGDNVRAGTKVEVVESNESNLTPGPVQYELNNTVVVGQDAPSFESTTSITPGQSRIVVDSCRAANNDAHGVHNSAAFVNVHKTVCELNGGRGFLDDSVGGAQANSNLYTRNKSYNNDGGNYSIDYVIPANPSVLQVGSVNPPVFPTAVAPEANVSLMQ